MTATLDYSLSGPMGQRAIERGLVDAEWFTPDIDPERLRALQARTDWRAALDTGLWLALLVASGVLAYRSMWSWWSIPAFGAYGALYGGAADARWHECSHGTAFAHRGANDAVYYLASFMLWRGPTLWRWSHYRHHTDTIIVGRDAEIVFPRPPSLLRAVLLFTHLRAGAAMLWRLVRHAAGRIDPDAADLVPDDERPAVVRESRLFVAIVLAAVVVSVVVGSIAPLMFVGLPTIYGAWLMVFFGTTQHAGLRENVLDHRYSTRTVYMNPILRFLYLNMNYHVEHHLLPSVPYHALPALHAEIRDQLAPALPNNFAAYRQIYTTFVRQRRDPTYEIPLDVPDVSGGRARRVDFGETGWAHRGDGSFDIGAAASLKPGTLRRIDIGQHTLVLCRLADHRLALGDGMCTHARVHLADGALVGDQIECPKHNAHFDTHTGEATRKPARQPICVYDVIELDGRITTTLHARSGITPATPNT